MSRQYFLVLCSFLLISTLVVAQDNSAIITGKVSTASGENLPGITVMLENTSKGAATNIEGCYEIKNISPDKYNLVVSGIGFTKISQTINLNPGQILELDIKLDEDTQQLAEVVILAESGAERLEKTAKAVQALDTREVKLKTADLGEVMARLEGVSVQRAGGLGSDTRFSLNGLTGDQVRFFLDGIPLDYSPYSFGMANVPVNNIERVEIYKGVVPIQFGADALGGAVNLVTANVPEGFSCAASYQTGSFGTQRITGSMKHHDLQSGLFVDIGGFYDFTENNYKVEVPVNIYREDGSATGKTRLATLPRFHDTYRAIGTNLAIGIKNRIWADELSIKGFYADYEKDVQHNQIMSGIPYGDVRSFNSTKGLNLIYRNNFSEKVNIELLSGFNRSERVFLDTSRFVYNWYGERLRESDGEILQTTQGEIGDANHQFTWDENFFARFNVSYEFSQNHSLKLTFAPSYSYRTGDELFEEGIDPLTADGKLLTVVSGLEYTSNALEGKLQNILFGKRYDQSLQVKRPVPSGFVVTERNVNYYGFGNGMRFEVSDLISAKLSYEYAIRMPIQDEVFGDGQFIQKNIDLQPERSHNANLEIRIEQLRSKSDWQVKSNFFLRKISDLILLIPANDRSSNYQNVYEANSLGVELAGKWIGLQDKLTLDFNTTYQHFYNNSQKGTFIKERGDRIPNTPYYFANGSAHYAWYNIFNETDKLSFFSTIRYVHEFYRNWESGGSTRYGNLKPEIPSQMINNLGATYELRTRKFSHSLTAEIQNVFNAMVFDFLGVQRPGRAFYIKLTTQF